MSVPIDIVIEAAAWSGIPDAESIVRRAVETSLADLKIHDGEISVLLCDDAHIRELNRIWRKKDQATNVLSFPAAKGSGALGDIALACETVTREAAAEEKSVEAHLSHLAVHGLLHLLGFDHENEKDAETMETRERKILAKLGFPDPYLERAETETA